MYDCANCKVFIYNVVLTIIYKHPPPCHQHLIQMTPPRFTSRKQRARALLKKGLAKPTRATGKTTGVGDLPDKETNPAARYSALRYRWNSWRESLMKIAGIESALRGLDERAKEEAVSKRSGRVRQPTDKQAALLEERKAGLLRMKEQAKKRKGTRVYSKKEAKSTKGRARTKTTTTTDVTVQTTQVEEGQTVQCTTVQATSTQEGQTVETNVRVRVTQRRVVDTSSPMSSPTSSEDSPRFTPFPRFPPGNQATLNRNGGGSCTMMADPKEEVEVLVLRLKSRPMQEMAGSPPSEHGSPTANDDNEEDWKVLEAIGEPPAKFVLGDEHGNPIDNGRAYSLDELDVMATRYQSPVAWWFFDDEVEVSSELMAAHPWLSMWTHKEPLFFLQSAMSG